MPATSCSQSKASARRVKSRCIARASSATPSSRGRVRPNWKTCCRRWAMVKPRPCRWSSRRTLKPMIKESGIDVRYYSIIYEAIDDVKQLLSGMLAPEVKEQIVGLAQVREVFRSSKFGTVAGCIVVDGYVRRNNPIRVLRDNVVIFEGGLESLRRFKDDVNEVRAGTECGIGVKNYNDVRVGDQIECYSRVEIARTVA